MHFSLESTMASSKYGMTGASATGASTAPQDGPPKELGHGAYGTVFLRSHPTLGLVAVKVFRIPAHCDAEALAMGILEVPHRSDRIIKYHGPNNRWSWPRSHANPDPSTTTDPSRPPKIPALVYEFCPFGDVEAFIREWHPILNQSVLCHWTRHVSEGLQFLASLDVVPRRRGRRLETGELPRSAGQNPGDCRPGAFSGFIEDANNHHYPRHPILSIPGDSANDGHHAGRRRILAGAHHIRMGD